MNANKDVTDNKTQTTYYSDTSSATGAKWLHFKVFRAIPVSYTHLTLPTNREV